MFNPSIQNPQRLYNLSLPQYKQYTTRVSNPYTGNEMVSGADKVPKLTSYSQSDYCSIRYDSEEAQKYNANYKKCMTNFVNDTTNPFEDERETPEQRQMRIIQQRDRVVDPFDITKYSDVDPKFIIKRKAENQIRPAFETKYNAGSDSRYLNEITESTVDKSKQPYSETRKIPFKLDIEQKTNEGFNQSSLSDTDVLYESLLRSYSIAVCDYLNKNPKYSKWKDNWKILEKNIKKTDLKMTRLSDRDKDVAYTQNKGDIIKFRWRDKLTYLPRSVFCYVLLHELTHQVFPSSFIGHKSPFPEMLCILCVAGYELRLFDLKNIPMDMVKSNGQAITSRKTLADEILIGIDMLLEQNPDSVSYYKQLKDCVLSDLYN